MVAAFGVAVGAAACRADLPLSNPAAGPAHDVRHSQPRRVDHWEETHALHWKETLRERAREGARDGEHTDSVAILGHREPRVRRRPLRGARQRGAGHARGTANAAWPQGKSKDARSLGRHDLGDTRSASLKV